MSEAPGSPDTRREAKPAPDHVGIRRSLILAAIVVVLVASLVRLYGLNWGLPFLHHSDEPTTIRTVQTMVRDRDPNPHFFDWPSLPFYIQTVPYLAFAGSGVALGAFESIDDVSLPVHQTLGNEFAANPNVVRIGRLTTMVFGVGLAMIALAIGFGITGRVWVGWLAGMLVALEPMLVKNARWMTPDTFVAFFALAAVAASLVVYRHGRPWQYLVAGAFVGAAASSKYNAALVAVAIVVAHLLRTRRRFFAEAGIYLAAAASLLVFVLTTPALLFAAGEVVDGIRYDLSHYAQGHEGHEGSALAFYLGALGRNIGPLLLLVPAAFIVPRVRASSLIVLSYPVLHIALISRFAVRFERNLLPAVAPLLVLVALGAYGIWHWGKRRSRAADANRTGAVVLVVGILLLGSIALLRTVEDAQRYSGDQRRAAQEWVGDNVAAGSRLVVEAYSPWIDPARFDVVPVNLALTDPAALDPNADFIIMTGQGSGRFLNDPDRYSTQVALLPMVTEGFCEVARFEGRETIVFYGRDCR